MKHQYKHIPSLFLSLLIAILLIDTSCAEANNKGEWSYDNYLYSLQILAYDDPIIPGQASEISLEIGSNTDVDVHIELKGKFAWGDWTFSEVIHPIQAGTSAITQSIEIPEKIIHEEAAGYYYYVYVTLPSDPWSSQAWGLVQNVYVNNEQPDFVIDEFPFGTMTSIFSALIALVIYTQARAHITF